MPQTPASIAAGAECFALELSSGQIKAGTLYAFLQEYAMSMTPQQIAAASECYGEKLSEGQIMAAILYTLNVGTGLNLTLDQLARNSECYGEKLSKGQIEAGILYAVSLGGGGGSCTNVTGAATNPNGSVTPAFVDQVYVSTGDSSVWQAGSLLNNSWVLICSVAATPTTMSVYATTLEEFINPFPNVVGAPTSLYFPNLLSITGGDLNLENWDASNNDLNTLSAPLLVSVGGNINIDELNLTTINFPLLATVGGQFIAFNQISTGPVSVSFPSLTTVTAGPMDFGGNPGMTSFDIPLLATCGTYLSFGSCGITGTASFPALVTCPQLSFGGNQITAVDLSVYDWTQNAIVNFQNNLLPQSEIDAILHAARIGGMTGGDLYLDGSGNAAPSAAGLADKAALITAGVTVTTN